MCVRFWNGVEVPWRLKKGKTLSRSVGQGHCSDTSRVSVWALRKCLLFICRGVRTLPGWGNVHKSLEPAMRKGRVGRWPAN